MRHVCAPDGALPADGADEPDVDDAVVVEEAAAVAEPGHQEDGGQALQVVRLPGALVLEDAVVDGPDLAVQLGLLVAQQVERDLALQQLRDERGHLEGCGLHRSSHCVDTFACRTHRWDGRTRGRRRSRPFFIFVFLFAIFITLILVTSISVRHWVLCGGDYDQFIRIGRGGLILLVFSRRHRRRRPPRVRLVHLEAADAAEEVAGGADGALKGVEGALVRGGPATARLIIIILITFVVSHGHGGRCILRHGRCSVQEDSDGPVE